MFSRKIICSDAFLELPPRTQILYINLGMNADDDGFVDTVKTILRTIGAKKKDLELLEDAGYLFTFPSGICVIRHWKIHNYIQKDRYKETLYRAEKNALFLNDDGVYQYCAHCIQNVSENGHDLDTSRIQNVSKPVSNLDTQGNRVKYNNITTTTARVRARERNGEKPVENNGENGDAEIPSIETVKAYFAENSIEGSPEAFYAYNQRKNAEFKRWRDYAHTWGILERREEHQKKQEQPKSTLGFNVDEFFETAVAHTNAIMDELMKEGAGKDEAAEL